MFAGSPRSGCPCVARTGFPYSPAPALPAVCRRPLTSRTISPFVFTCRITRIHPPVLHVRRISTVRLSMRCEDWVPIQSSSCSARGLPSPTPLQDHFAVRIHLPDNSHPPAGFACSQDLHGPVVHALRGLGSHTVQLLLCPRFAVAHSPPGPFRRSYSLAG